MRSMCGTVSGRSMVLLPFRTLTQETAVATPSFPTWSSAVGFNVSVCRKEAASRSVWSGAQRGDEENMELFDIAVIGSGPAGLSAGLYLSLIHISEPTRLRRISYAVFCLKKKKKQKKQQSKIHKHKNKKKVKKKKNQRT